MDNQRKQFVQSLIGYAVQRDINAQQLCTYSNVDFAAVKNDPAYIITDKQVEDLWFQASHLCSDPLFGLHFGESLQLSALGIVGEIIKGSRTVGEAITIAASLTPLITDRFVIEVIRSNEWFKIRIRLVVKPLRDNFFERQFMDLLMVFSIHELDGLVFEKVKPEKVVYAYPISEIQEYTRILRCVPTVQKNECAIYFNSKYWGEPILSADYELQQFLLQKVKSSLRDAATPKYREQIFQHLLSNAYLGIPSLQDVAANFNITPRSLQRRLQAEGATFQQLSDDVRKLLALHYLESGKHPVKEISHMLGYNELSAFSRAFKRWTGKAPGNYLS
ncbi:AraC family transcriptional regulator [Chryseolinea sp. H1M3-3]|uniref:helix-turn-helix transcriptional regulator n=1 Tax=Chryseolinea sp. H1M3-3 TaxID=3034144 RepID=UPI0023ECCC0A|nr:AraC family transcriptional regulator [Chryseolinea sp. H1M3-3]